MKRTAPKFGLLTLCNVGYIWETIYILGSILTGGKRSQLHNYDIVCFDSKITLPSSGDYKLSFITFHLQKVVCNTRMRKYKIWDLPWLGDNLIRSKDPHPVKRSLWLFLRWQLAANDLVLLERPLTLHFELQNKISALQHEIQKGKKNFVSSASSRRPLARLSVLRRLLRRSPLRLRTLASGSDTIPGKLRKWCRIFKSVNVSVLVLIQILQTWTWVQ